VMASGLVDLDPIVSPIELVVRATTGPPR
jgi:hypothetical protein